MVIEDQSSTSIHIPPPNRVLIIKPSAIGDIVHALPILPWLRRLWPGAEISWMATPQCAGLVENHPMIAQVIIFRRARFGRGWHSPAAAWDLVRFVQSIRRQRFDIVLDLQGLFRSAWVALASGSPCRVGFSNAREGAPLFYTHHVHCSWDNDHAVDRYLKIARALGCREDRIEFPLAVDDSDRQYVAGLIPADIPYAVLVPGANWQTKRWPVEYYMALALKLKSRFGLESVVVGGVSDAGLARQINARFDLTGKTNLRQIVAVMERGALVVANDTGPMHIAAALGRPLVTPYGPTSPLRTGPYGRDHSVIRLDMPCSPCFSRTCVHQSCLRWLSLDLMVEFAQSQMSHYGYVPKNGK